MSTDQPLPPPDDQAYPAAPPPPPPPRPPPPAPGPAAQTAAGAQPPPAGYVAPSPGYPAPPPGHVAQPGGPVPAPLQSDETLWAVLAHLSYFVLALIGPLVIMLVAGPQRPFARANAVEALNFHITVLIGLAISMVLMFVIIGFFTFFAIAIAGLVLAIIAAVKAGQGEGYRYPLTLRLVK